MEPDVVKRGYLKVTASKGLGSSLPRFGQKKHWVILRSESRTSKSRIEVFKGEDDALRKTPSRVLSIGEVTSVQSGNERKELTLVMPGETVTFTCSSRADQDDWLRDIELLRHSGGIGGMGNRKSAGGVVSQPEEEVFRVRLRQSPSLLFHGPCILEIQQDLERNLFHIALLCDENPPRLLVKWQIDHIRQYGSNEVAFKFQSGSKSPTNVDWFILDTEAGDAPKIHRLVDYWAHHIVEQARNTSLMMPPRRDTMTSAMPSRNLPISPPSPPPVSSRLSASVPTNGTYQPLMATTRQQVPIYDGIDNRQLPSTPPPASVGAPLPPPLPPNNSLYQSLNTSSINGHGNYADLNEVTRVRTNSTHPAPPIPPPPLSQSSEYMGLDQATRIRQEPAYMDLNASKT